MSQQILEPDDSQLRAWSFTVILTAWCSAVHFGTTQCLAPKRRRVSTRLHGATCSYGQQPSLVSTSALLTQYLLLLSVKLLVVCSSDIEMTGDTCMCRTTGKGLSSISGPGRVQKPYGRNTGMLRGLVYVTVLPLMMVSVLHLVRPFEFAVSRGPYVLFDTLRSFAYLVLIFFI